MLALPLIWRAVAVLVALAAVLGIVAYGVRSIKADGAAQAQAAAAHEREVAAVQAAAAAASAQQESSRRVAAVQGEANVAEIQARAARADAAAAANRARGLQHTLDAIRARGAGGNDPAASDVLANERRRSALLAELLEGADDLAGRAAAEAGELRAAGLGCERSYDALSASAPTP